jgi:hypothetical protein
MARPESQPKEASNDRIGSRSTLFLVFAYRYGPNERRRFHLDDFEKLVTQSGSWKRKNIDDAGLLPHLDAQVEQGIIVRAFETGADYSNMFDPRLVWNFQREERAEKRERRGRKQGR